MQAAFINDAASVKLLLEKGADKNLLDEKHKVALDYALEYHASEEIVRMLKE